MTRRATLRWAAWLAALAALTVAMLAARERLDKAHVALAYLLAVLGASAAGGRALGLTVAGIAFLAFNWLFLPPYHTLVIADPLDWIVLVAFLVTSVVAAQLLYRATATAVAATQRAEEVDRLAALGAETLSAPGADEALQAVATVMRDAIGVDTCEVYRRDGETALVRAAVATRVSALTESLGTRLGGPESLLHWLVERGGSAVELVDGTVRLSSGDVRSSLVARDGPPMRAVLLPLVARDHTVGVLRVSSTTELSLAPEQARLLVALAYYAALGVERMRLVEMAERAEAERRVEALRSALLTAVSHDLRTPLTTIKGIAHEIAHGADPASAASIEAEADRLDALVADLLDLSRIHAGAVRPDIAVNTVDDLVGAALQRARGPLGGREVIVDVPELLAGRFDFTQALRVLVNLLENAAKYAPAGTPIEIRASRVDNRLCVAVLDRGPGIPASENERIFEPFYRPPRTPIDVRGTGLGLSIARGLAEAQGGAVRHEARAGGGSMFVLELPAIVESL